MENVNLIKDGKLYDPAKSTLIATSSWWMWYDYQRNKIYKTAKGAFFILKEIGTSQGFGGGEVPVKSFQVIEVLTEKRLKEMFEYRSKHGWYSVHVDGRKYRYEFHKQYSELFEIEEG
jgi:hypothetical protein